MFKVYASLINVCLVTSQQNNRVWASGLKIDIDPS